MPYGLAIVPCARRADERAPLSRHLEHKMVMDCDGTIVRCCIETTPIVLLNFLEIFSCVQQKARRRMECITFYKDGVEANASIRQ